jgi:Phage tail lysozyme
MVSMNQTEIYKNATISYNFWVATGLFKTFQVFGILGNMEAESDFNAHALGDDGAAYNCFQWHEDRASVILEGCGIDVKTCSLPDALKACEWELRNPEKHALKMIQESTSAYAAAGAFCLYYERPGDVKDEMNTRGLLAQKWQKYFNGLPLLAPADGKPT